ncbi:hypothetical protein BLNAU_12925 [Blattamonas nauphoetae]|uniref:Uncharacterized protein n=1 Tax=Blattamonas nauphoetae TaxID=2049346 RepID=A0ABQ9XMN7_9EUKA|nr:hypothetical protein BLNAU_12925 [Blattamonas nauphoetae]
MEEYDLVWERGNRSFTINFERLPYDSLYYDEQELQPHHVNDNIVEDMAEKFREIKQPPSFMASLPKKKIRQKKFKQLRYSDIVRDDLKGTSKPHAAFEETQHTAHSLNDNLSNLETARQAAKPSKNKHSVNSFFGQSVISSSCLPTETLYPYRTTSQNFTPAPLALITDSVESAVVEHQLGAIRKQGLTGKSFQRDILMVTTEPDDNNETHSTFRAIPSVGPLHMVFSEVSTELQTQPNQGPVVEKLISSLSQGLNPKTGKPDP